MKAAILMRLSCFLKGGFYMESRWNPALYLQFESERTRPARELLARVDPVRVRYVTDLGCGPGNSTEWLVKAWPDALVTGLDNSASMLDAACRRLEKARFVLGDIGQWKPERLQDVIFANASLQWLSGHELLFPRLAGYLEKGGVLAVQMPDNLDEPTHVLMRETAEEPGWCDKMGDAGAFRQRLLPMEAYYDLLAEADCTVDMWKTVYCHVMPSVEAIAQWLKATGLRPFLVRLDKEEQALFLDRYITRLKTVYRPRSDGTVLLAFPRLFMVAKRRQ